MQSTVSAKRKNDAVITVCQNNREKSLEIEGVNSAAEKLTGYLDKELHDKALETILPKKVKDTLKNYLEFDEMGNDLASVLRKIPEFHILNKEGKEIPVSLKVFYVIASHSQKPQFELLMRDITLLRKMEELKTKILESQQENTPIDSAIGIPDAHAVHTNLELIHSFVREHSFEASFTVMQIDNLDMQNTETADEAMKHICSITRDSLREADILGYLGNGHIGLALFDCNAEDAKLVLNRLRMTIESQPFHGKKVTVSIGFMQLAFETDIEVTIAQCSRALQKALDAGGNRIYEV